MPLQIKRMPTQPHRINLNDTSDGMGSFARKKTKPLTHRIMSDHEDMDCEILAESEAPRNSTFTLRTSNGTTKSHSDSTPDWLATTQSKKPSASLPPADDAAVGTYQYHFGHFDGFERSQPRRPISPPQLFRFRQHEIPSTPYQPPRLPARNATGANQRLPFDTPAVLRGPSAFSSSSGDRVQGLEDPFVDAHTSYQFPGINYVPWNRR